MAEPLDNPLAIDGKAWLQMSEFDLAGFFAHGQRQAGNGAVSAATGVSAGL